MASDALVMQGARTSTAILKFNYFTIKSGSVFCVGICSFHMRIDVIYTLLWWGYSSARHIMFIKQYHKISWYKLHQIPKLKCFSSHLAVVFAQSVEAMNSFENEDVVGAAPVGDAPTTSEWWTILLSTKVRLIIELMVDWSMKMNVTHMVLLSGWSFIISIYRASTTLCLCLSLAGNTLVKKYKVLWLLLAILGVSLYDDF